MGLSVEKTLRVLKENGFGIEEAISLFEEMEWGWSVNCDMDTLSNWIECNKKDLENKSDE